MIITFKALRQRENKTAAELASELGISESAYRKYECSARIPQGRVIVAMKKAYSCTEEEIMAALKYHTTNRKS